ncbi:hypothetical protein J2Z76_000472 [Sedimentibacter acidaminivorans]|uniref:Uncharacterized protein n=1 Tax=Sedimentibacter acidaminivorans TaxID=913099 RepID=A0ABS4GAA7_9FIRM|nr:hypothetical protein [Sedimentibacter acidaminivorans]MBP1924619.1 hypothetical protein [Sedimentibacter acidaminivorans]
MSEKKIDKAITDFKDNFNMISSILDGGNDTAEYILNILKRHKDQILSCKTKEEL